MHKPNPTRRQFLIGSSLAGAALATGAIRAVAQQPAAAPPAPGASPSPVKKIPDRGPALAADLVKAFVGAAHGDLATTQAMLAQTPKLLNATWDWGGGDFETALGGASHMGRRDIAQFLLEKGARLDLFAATMLGYLEVVRATLQVRPDALACPGPHGIPLLAHAKAGGGEAAAVFALLQELLKAT